MTTQRIRPEGTSMGSWTMACLGVSAKIGAASFPVMGPVGAFVGGFSAILFGGNTFGYTFLASMAGSIVTPALTGVAVVAATHAAVKLGLAKLPSNYHCR